MSRVSVQIQRAGKTDVRLSKLYTSKNQKQVEDDELGQKFFSENI